MGVLIGAGITWVLARGERQHRIQEARRAEKIAAFERLAVHVLRIENAKVNSPEIVKQLTTEFEEVWIPVLMLCDKDGPVSKELRSIKPMTADTGLEKGTAVRLTKAMHEELQS